MKSNNIALLGALVLMQSVYAANAQDQRVPVVEKAASQSSKECIVPALVPFNRVLFNRYCTRMIKVCEEKGNPGHLFAPGFFAVISPFILYDTFGSTKCLLQNFAAHFDSPWSVLKSVGHTGYCLYRVEEVVRLTATMASCISALYLGIKKLCKKDHLALQEKWEVLICAPAATQEKEWHTIIYEKLGKPIVKNGASDCQGTHQFLVFQKKYGAGCVRFDTLDEQQVEILLGIHPTIQDDLRSDLVELVKLF